MLVTVVFTWSEVRLSAVKGVDRNLRALYKGRRRLFGRDSGWDENIIGALGEDAVAKHLDRYPSRGPELDYEGDVGHVQVRATTHPLGRLIVKREDADGAAFVLARVTEPVVVLVGWLYGHEAKRDQWWEPTAHSPAYFVPEHALRPMDGLPPTL